VIEVGFWGGGACNCQFHGDLDADGEIGLLDAIQLVNTAFRNMPNPPADALCPHFNRGDVDCDGEIGILDVVIEVGVAFRNDDRRCNPCAD
jgi:hypothetical protein